MAETIDISLALRGYLSRDGRIVQWPSRKSRGAMRAHVLEFLSQKFERGRRYKEREVNEILNRFHTFDDAALLRRELFDQGFMGREPDGSAYWLL